MKPITLALALSGLAAATPAFAATDGTVGPTSTGTMQVSISLEQPPASDVQIFGLDDIAFGSHQTDIFQIQTGRTFCMTKSDGGTVNLMIIDNVNPNAFADPSITFALANAGVFLPMKIDIHEPAGQVLGMIEGFAIQFTASPTCIDGGAGDFAISVTIPVDPSDALGSYSSTLTLLVAPN